MYFFKVTSLYESKNDTKKEKSGTELIGKHTDRHKSFVMCRSLSEAEDVVTRVNFEFAAEVSKVQIA